MTHKPVLTKSKLCQFTGTAYWYRHHINRSIHYTDGVKYVAEVGEAYWLIDEIALIQNDARIAPQEFQHWTLTVNDDSTARLVCYGGNRNTVYEKDVAFTGFPLDTISFYLANNVLLLPSEY